MTHKYSWWMILLLVLSLSIAAPALAQAPTPPTPKDVLIQDIQARAERDVDLGKPAEGIAELQILFGEEAAQVGLSMAKVLGIYEEAYAEATPDDPWWAELRPNAGWIAAAILFVLFILRDVLEENLTKLINWLDRGHLQSLRQETGGQSHRPQRPGRRNLEITLCLHQHNG